ncbi:hypothetical protein C8R44DRAFT_745763 [Mycena epipterygia]|nr:hypothetical protein C8R44DRAFT_745763 [Mycena epipterygia]
MGMPRTSTVRRVSCCPRRPDVTELEAIWLLGSRKSRWVTLRLVPSVLAKRSDLQSRQNKPREIFEKKTARSGYWGGPTGARSTTSGMRTQECCGGAKKTSPTTTQPQPPPERAGGAFATATISELPIANHRREFCDECAINVGRKEHYVNVLLADKETVALARAASVESQPPGVARSRRLIRFLLSELAWRRVRRTVSHFYLHGWVIIAQILWRQNKHAQSSPLVNRIKITLELMWCTNLPYRAAEVPFL